MNFHVTLALFNNERSYFLSSPSLPDYFIYKYFMMLFPKYN